MIELATVRKADDAVKSAVDDITQVGRAVEGAQDRSGGVRSCLSYGVPAVLTDSQETIPGL